MGAGGGAGVGAGMGSGSAVGGKCASASWCSRSAAVVKTMLHWLHGMCRTSGTGTDCPESPCSSPDPLPDPDPARSGGVELPDSPLYRRSSSGRAPICVLVTDRCADDTPNAAARLGCAFIMRFSSNSSDGSSYHRNVAGCRSLNRVPSRYAVSPLSGSACTSSRRLDAPTMNSADGSAAALGTAVDPASDGLLTVLVRDGRLPDPLCKKWETRVKPTRKQRKNTRQRRGHDGGGSSCPALTFPPSSQPMGSPGFRIVTAILQQKQAQKTRKTNEESDGKLPSPKIMAGKDVAGLFL